MRAREATRLMKSGAAWSTLFMDKIGKVERNQYISIAKDLGYGPSTLDRIKHAETEYEISRIMADARHEAIKNEKYSE